MVGRVYFHPVMSRLKDISSRTPPEVLSNVGLQIFHLWSFGRTFPCSGPPRSQVDAWLNQQNWLANLIIARIVSSRAANADTQIPKSNQSRALPALLTKVTITSGMREPVR
jgi:hypothetical protein